MRVTPPLVNGLWATLCLPETFLFHRAARNVEAVQRGVLSRLLHANRQTAFGLRYGFGGIRSAEDYASAVPFSDYTAYRSSIDALLRGETGCLTAEAPVRLVPTSGSCGTGKLIPFTPALRREFQKGIAPWIACQFLRHPGLFAGSAYWSISPALPPAPGGGAIPVGFDADTDYLHPLIGRLLPRIMAVPPFVAGIRDLDTFRYVTLLYLLKARDLSFISVWNPTFLGLLLAPLDAWGERLADDLQAGRLKGGAEILEPIRAGIAGTLGRHPKRAAEIRRLLATRRRADPARFAPLWPNLALISCWTDAAAAGPARDLEIAFPGVPLSPKGLLATEGIVSTPVGRAEGAALAIRSHYYEFLEDNDPARLRSAWQLEKGRSYAVILTTGGGFYRYRLGDLVRVTGFLGQCPLLQFSGRCDNVSDFYGEKLSEAHVADVVSRLLDRHRIGASFRMLVPDGIPRPDHYALLLAGSPGPATTPLQPLESELDAALSENFHYAYCRRLGQLAPASIRWLPCGEAEASRRYLLGCVGRGQKAGEIKPVALDRRPGWPNALDFPHGRRNGE